MIKLPQSVNLTSVESEIAAAQNDPAARAWLRQALIACQHIDPIDACHDAEWLAALLIRRADAILGLNASKKTDEGNSASVAAIQFALDADAGIEFLRSWNQDDFDVIREKWPEAPEAVFIGADPLHKSTELS